MNPTFICDHPQLMSPLAKWCVLSPIQQDGFPIAAREQRVAEMEREGALFSTCAPSSLLRTRFVRSRP